VASSESAPTVLELIGLVVDQVSGAEAIGHVDFGARHHQGGGIVHGGVYAHIIETIATIGSSAAVRERGQRTVGVNNQTDFLRPFSTGRVEVRAFPIQQGRTLQLWQVELTGPDGKLVARGQVRLFNQPLAP